MFLLNNSAPFVAKINRKHSICLYVLAIVLITLFGCEELNKPEDTVTGSITGTVFDAHTETPIPGVLISIKKGRYTTDTNGEYSLSSIDAGERIIEAYRGDYAPYSKSIIIPSDAEVLHNIYLTKTLENSTGSITGKLRTTVLDQVIDIYLSTSKHAVVNSSGTFILTDVIPGTHSVYLDMDSNFFDEAISGITVYPSSNTDLGQIELRDLFIDAVVSADSSVEQANLCIGYSDLTDYAIIPDSSWMIFDLGLNEELQNDYDIEPDFILDIAAVDNAVDSVRVFVSENNANTFEYIVDQARVSELWYYDISDVTTSKIRFVRIETFKGAIKFKYCKIIK